NASATTWTTSHGHAGHDQPRFSQHAQRDSAVHYADADDGTVFGRKEARNDRVVVNRATHGRPSCTGQIFGGGIVLHHSFALDLGSDGCPLLVWKSRIGTDLDCVFGLASLRTGDRRGGTVYIDTDGESDHSGRPQLWNDHGSVVG